ncbi:peptidyl-prolyl cis-trans isomerase [Rhodocaloribacter litoris]|uniref:peptidyl-prolyl cis-trans isomerase n=1 Tax=Rhodocaloribacter litoris TaxID=2558931 RepID=UPI001E4AE170|nr:peptidyl-prolyl cis-trans isomerase [Rhodocaloribacter litoris]
MILRSVLRSVPAPWIGAAAMLAVLAGCRPESPAPDYIARVGDRYLTRGELAAALETLPFVADSAETSRQIIEQWISNELLYREARRLNLRDDPAVRRLLEDNERSVLISAYINRLYENELSEPSPASIQAYFEQHREQLRLREPYVRIRYLAHPDPDSAALAHERLAAARTGPDPDSAWVHIATRFAADPEGVLSLSGTYHPEARLFSAQPRLQEVLRTLNDGQLAPLIAFGNRHHVLQLVERIPAGTVPEPAWIEEELKQRLMIEARKQMYARQVQRLRNEALAREALEIR